MHSKKQNNSNRYTSGNEVKLIRGGKEYFDLMLTLIEKAEETIHLQVYIFREDKTGELVASALKKAAERKVEVFLMADGYASQSLSKSFIHDLEKTGVNFRLFEPLFKSSKFYFGRRMHHKILVVDGRRALTGGINIADRYNDIDGIPAWLDFALYTDGEIAKDLCVLCWKTWSGYPLKMDTVPCGTILSTYHPPKDKSSLVRIRRNDWVRRKNEISSSYVQIFRNAQSQATVLCSYFLPGKVIRKQMRLATSRGVALKVIVSGTSDIKLSKSAERWLYDWLLRSGVELFEYRKNILHGKIAVCDDTWLTVGSYNINDISAYASIELNLDVRDAAFVFQVRNVLNDIIVNDCIKITKEQHLKSKNAFSQFTRWLSYELVRAIFHLFTFYFKRTA